MLIFAAISGFIYVAFGAFGAHILKFSLGENEMAWISTGLQYQGLHTLAMLTLGMGMSARINRWWYWSALFFALGIVLFSGSLYSLALWHMRPFAYITPMGGFCFLIGWILLLMGALRLGKKGKVE